MRLLPRKTIVFLWVTQGPSIQDPWLLFPAVDILKLHLYIPLSSFPVNRLLKCRICTAGFSLRLSNKLILTGDQDMIVEKTLALYHINIEYI